MACTDDGEWRIWSLSTYTVTQGTDGRMCVQIRDTPFRWKVRGEIVLRDGNSQDNTKRSAQKHRRKKKCALTSRKRKRVEETCGGESLAKKMPRLTSSNEVPEQFSASMQYQLNSQVCESDFSSQASIYDGVCMEKQVHLAGYADSKLADGPLMMTTRDISNKTYPVLENRHSVIEKTLPVFEENIPANEEHLPVFEKHIPANEEQLPVFEEKFPTIVKEVCAINKKLPDTIGDVNNGAQYSDSNGLEVKTEGPLCSGSTLNRPQRNRKMPTYMKDFCDGSATTVHDMIVSKPAIASTKKKSEVDGTRRRSLPAKRQCPICGEYQSNLWRHKQMHHRKQRTSSEAGLMELNNSVTELLAPCKGSDENTIGENTANGNAAGQTITNENAAIEMTTNENAATQITANENAAVLSRANENTAVQSTAKENTAVHSTANENAAALSTANEIVAADGQIDDNEDITGLRPCPLCGDYQSDLHSHTETHHPKMFQRKNSGGKGSTMTASNQEITSPKKERRYTKWSKEDTATVLTYFNKWMCLEKMPGKKEIVYFKQRHPEVVYSWDIIKVKLINEKNAMRMKAQKNKLQTNSTEQMNS